MGLWYVAEDARSVGAFDRLAMAAAARAIR
jgi:hypothetical protein